MGFPIHIPNLLFTIYYSTSRDNQTVSRVRPSFLTANCQKSRRTNSPSKAAHHAFGDGLDGKYDAALQHHPHPLTDEASSSPIRPCFYRDPNARAGPGAGQLMTTLCDPITVSYSSFGSAVCPLLGVFGCERRLALPARDPFTHTTAGQAPYLLVLHVPATLQPSSANLRQSCWAWKLDRL
jgi:hypothetical protein